MKKATSVLTIGGTMLTVIGGIIAIVLKFCGEDDLSVLLRKGSDEELQEEREKIRQDYCNPKLDMKYREDCRRKLDRFDAEISKRAWGDEEPHGPSYHREHGWYLPNDD